MSIGARSCAGESLGEASLDEDAGDPPSEVGRPMHIARGLEMLGRERRGIAQRVVAARRTRERTLSFFAVKGTVPDPVERDPRRRAML
jgi:hypothetical protein